MCYILLLFIISINLPLYAKQATPSKELKNQLKIGRHDKIQLLSLYKIINDHMKNIIYPVNKLDSQKIIEMIDNLSHMIKHHPELNFAIIIYLRRKKDLLQSLRISEKIIQKLKDKNIINDRISIIFTHSDIDSSEKPAYIKGNKIIIKSSVKIIPYNSSYKIYIDSLKKISINKSIEKYLQ